MLQLDFDTVIPGHGPVAKKADMLKWRNGFVELRSRAKKACAGGGGAAEAYKRVNFSGLTDMDDSLGFLKRGMDGVCAELANSR